LSGVLSITVFLFQLFAVPLITYWHLNLYAKKQKYSTDTEQQGAAGPALTGQGKQRQ